MLRYYIVLLACVIIVAQSISAQAWDYEQYEALSKLESQWQEYSLKMHEYFWQSQSQLLERMHKQLSFNQDLRMLRYEMALLANEFQGSEIQYKSYQVFTATLPSQAPSYRQNAVMQKAQALQKSWEKLAQKYQEESEFILESDIKDFQYLSQQYSQVTIIVPRNGVSENILKISPYVPVRNQNLRPSQTLPMPEYKKLFPNLPDLVVIAPKIKGFKALRRATYTCAGLTNTVTEYLHELTGMEFVLLPKKNFLISKTEVTQAVWQKIMGNNPSNFTGANRPVEQVSWKDCEAFCQKTGLRLPTENEWEYACRAGSTSDWCYGNHESGLGEYAWYNGNSGSQTHPVAEKKPNAFGLYDMHGNVWEWCQDHHGNQWCQDHHGNHYYKMGSARVIRGGGYGDSAPGFRSFRTYSPFQVAYNLGFRVCLLIL